MIELVSVKIEFDAKYDHIQYVLYYRTYIAIITIHKHSLHYLKFCSIYTSFILEG